MRGYEMGNLDSTKVRDGKIWTSDEARIFTVGRRVAIRDCKDEHELKTQGGIHLLDNSEVMTTSLGLVCSVGHRMSIDIRVGDKIRYIKHTGVGAPLPEGDVTFIDEDNILAILG